MSNHEVVINGRRYRRNPTSKLGWEYMNKRLGMWREVPWENLTPQLELLDAILDLRERAVPEWGGDWFKDVDAALKAMGVERGESDA